MSLHSLGCYRRNCAISGRFWAILYHFFCDCH